MYDFSKQVRKFHEDHVRLTSDEQSDMRSRRERNLKRIEHGLAELDKPKVAETIHQGGYAQRNDAAARERRRQPVRHRSPTPRPG